VTTTAGIPHGTILRTQLGLPFKVEPHEHEAPSVTDGNAWACDICNKMGSSQTRLHCHECDYDICQTCMDATKLELTDEVKRPGLFLIDFKNTTYWPMGADAELTGESVTKFIEDYKNGNVGHVLMKSEVERKPMMHLFEDHTECMFKPTLFLFQELASKETQEKNNDMLMEIAEWVKEETKPADRKPSRFITVDKITTDAEAAGYRTNLKLPRYANKDEHEMTKFELLDGKGAKPYWCRHCHRKLVKSAMPNWRCEECNKNSCNLCYEISNREIDEKTRTPFVCMLHWNEAIYLPVEGKSEVTKENVLGFIEDYQSEKCQKFVLGD
jgi:ribosomal protein L37AE/L43A